MISKDCRSSQQQESILASHRVRVAQIPLSSSPAMLQDKQGNSKKMRHLKPLPAWRGLEADWCELQPLPFPVAWGWPHSGGSLGPWGVSLDWVCPASALLCLQLLGYPLLCLPGTCWVALVCLCFLNQISPAALGSSRLRGAPLQECREQDSSLSSLPEILIHFELRPLNCAASLSL